MNFISYCPKIRRRKLIPGNNPSHRTSNRQPEIKPFKLNRGICTNGIGKLVVITHNDYILMNIINCPVWKYGILTIWFSAKVMTLLHAAGIITLREAWIVKKGRFIQKTKKGLFLLYLSSIFILHRRDTSEIP
jgi:hypothetical protein